MVTMKLGDDQPTKSVNSDENYAVKDAAWSNSSVSTEEEAVQKYEPNIRTNGKECDGTFTSLYEFSPGTGDGLYDRRINFEVPKQRRYSRFGSFSVPVNDLSIKLYGSTKAVQKEQQRLKNAGWFIIHPYSSFRLIWDVLTVFILLLNVIFIPVAISFWKGDEEVWLRFKQISDFWFLLDMIMNFRTGVVLEGPDSEVILEPAQIRIIYLRSWFTVDFISTFPIELFLTFFDTMDVMGIDFNVDAMRLVRVTKILALLRLLRISRFIRYVRQWQQVITLKYELAAVIFRIVNLLMLLFYICHFNGCLQWMVPMFFNFPKTTWVHINQLHLPGVSIWERYSWSLFKATSHMLCIGYGQNPPRGLIDVWVTYISMTSGALCFALFIGNATSIIQSMDATSKAYQAKFGEVKEFMKFRQLPQRLRVRIGDYYERRFHGKMFDEEEILQELNHNLRDEVIHFTCKDLVNQAPFFINTEPTFVNALLEKLKLEVFLCGDRIITEGTVGTKMYFIDRGTVRVEHFGLERRLHDGSCFGEAALLESHNKVSENVIAESYCYLYSLSAKDFKKVIKEFPKQYRQFRHRKSSHASLMSSSHLALTPNRTLSTTSLRSVASARSHRVPRSIHRRLRRTKSSPRTALARIVEESSESMKQKTDDDHQT